jgi:hypothetical protein
MKERPHRKTVREVRVVVRWWGALGGEPVDKDR